MIPDWLTKIPTLIKIPVTYMWVVSLATGFVLIAPDTWLNGLCIDQFRSTHGQSLGSAFVICTAIGMVTVATGLGRKYMESRRRAQRLLETVKELERLDLREAAILREFFIQGQNTLQLPVDQANVAGLLKKGVIEVSGTQGELSLAGALFPVAIVRELRDFISPETLGLPPEPTDEEVARLRRERPGFLAEIAHHKEVFHTTWHAGRFRL